MTLNNFTFNTTSGIRFGSGASVSSSQEISKILGSNILFITDKDLMSLKLTEPTLNQLKKFSSKVEIFEDVEADVIIIGTSCFTHVAISSINLSLEA